MVEKKRLNLLVVSSYYRPAFIYGGPVESIHRRSLVVADLGHQVTTYTTDADGTGDLEVPKGRPVLVDRLPVWYFPRWWFGRARKPFSIFFSPEMGRQLRRLKAGDYDLLLIHAGFGDPGRMAAAAARRTGIPYVCYTHGCLEPWALNHKYWKKRIYLALIEGRILQEAAGIIVCNDAETQELRRLGIRSPVGPIPWGVDLPDPDKLPGQERLEELWPHLAGRPFALFLSRLHPKKGLDLLIPAFASLAQEFPDWLLVLAGPDERGYQAKLMRLVEELNLSQKVLFPGMVTGDGKAALLAHAQFLVLPSYSEGFPVAVAEALGYGRPVVITNTCYVSGVAEEGAGLVVPPEGRALRDALGKMMRDPALRQSCSQQALQVAQTHYSLETVAQQSLAFYRKAINSKK